MHRLTFAPLNHDCEDEISVHDANRSEREVLVAAGFQGDIRTLQKLMQVRNVMYQHNHRRPMGVNALAQLLGNTLYYKRFFPYYTWNLTCGLDDQGELP